MELSFVEGTGGVENALVPLFIGRGAADKLGKRCAIQYNSSISIRTARCSSLVVTTRQAW